MKKISEKQNGTKKIFSKEIKITDEEMKRNYYKFLAMAFFGFVLVISPLIVLISSWRVDILLFLIPLNIAIGAYGLYGIYLHKRKPEKQREILEKIIERKKSGISWRRNGRNRRIIYYLLIVVSLDILIFTSWMLIFLITLFRGGGEGFLMFALLIPVILSLICFVFGIYKSIRERRTKSS